MSTLSPDTSPAMLLDRVRGPVTAACLAYPERMHLEITDADGGLWRLATWDAVYSPADPECLIGRTVVDASLARQSGVLTISFSDEPHFTATPTSAEGNAGESWELFTPEGLVLVYGPKGQWQLVRADGAPGDLLLRPPKSDLAPIRDSRQWKQACREMKLTDDERELASKDLHAFQLAEGAGQ